MIIGIIPNSISVSMALKLRFGFAGQGNRFSSSSLRGLDTIIANIDYLNIFTFKN
jgi:hypothetical protein